MNETSKPNVACSKAPCSRKCGRCGLRKAIGEFYKTPKGRDGYFGYCKKCANQANKAWATANRDAVLRSQRKHNKKFRKKKNAESLAYYYANKARKSDYKRIRNITKYGITKEKFDSMLSEQEGCCAICRKPPAKVRLAIDHCHRSGDVRGLLCSFCNRALGLFGDDLEILNSAIKYLEKQIHKTLHP